jgi:CheY-like chemotaxis protein
MKSIKFLEENGVDIKSSLELLGDEATYNETVLDYLTGVYDKLNQLVDFLKKEDLENYSIYVHSLKSDSKYYGFTKLAEIAYEHEMKSKAKDINYIVNHIVDLVNEGNNTIRLLNDYVEGEKPEEKKEETKQIVFDKKTILVVDDSNIVRNFVKRSFDDKYNVASAEDGEEAIKVIDANKDNDMIEAILLDLNMPKVDGFGVLEYIKANNLFKKMPVSIISGDSSKETIDKAFTYPIVDMLSKPFSDQNVKMVIDKTLIYKQS